MSGIYISATRTVKKTNLIYPLHMQTTKIPKTHSASGKNKFYFHTEIITAKSHLQKKIAKDFDCV